MTSVEILLMNETIQKLELFLKINVVREANDYKLGS